MPAWRRYVERRLAFALERFGERIGLVRVRLTDVNGPKGGMDKRCMILLRVHPAGDIRVAAVASLPSEAVDGASDRASRAVTKALAQNKRRTDRRHWRESVRQLR